MLSGDRSKAYRLKKDHAKSNLGHMFILTNKIRVHTLDKAVKHLD
jgi:hypothetical protein